MWNTFLMTDQACALKCLLSAEGCTRRASQRFPDSFSFQEVWTQRKAHNRMFPLKLTALLESEGGLLTQQISVSYQHTGLSGRCCLEIILTHTEFQLSTASARVTPVLHSPQISKKSPWFFSCRLQHSITTYTMCLRNNNSPWRKKINTEKNAVEQTAI